MNAIRYLLDENVDPVYRTELLRREPGLTIWRVGAPGLPPTGTPDPEILDWCEMHGFLLVTNNRRSMPGHLQDRLAAGGHIPGVLILNPNMGLGETIEELLTVWAVSREDEYRDQIIFLPIS